MIKVTCYTKGEARGNPGPATIEVKIEGGTAETALEITQSIGNATALFAAYYAVMVCLQKLQERYQDNTKTTEFEITLENEQAKKQLNAESPINDPGLVPMFIEIHNMRVTSFPNLVLVHATSSRK